MILEAVVVLNTVLTSLLLYQNHRHKVCMEIKARERADSRVCFKCKQLKTKHETNAEGKTYCFDCLRG